MDVSYRTFPVAPAPTPAHPALSPSADDSPRRVATGAPLHLGDASGRSVQRDPAIASAVASVCASGRISQDMLFALLDLALLADELSSALIHRELTNPRVSGEPVSLMDRTIGRGLDALRLAGGAA